MSYLRHVRQARSFHKYYLKGISDTNNQEFDNTTQMIFGSNLRTKAQQTLVEHVAYAAINLAFACQKLQSVGRYAFINSNQFNKKISYTQNVLYLATFD